MSVAHLTIGVRTDEGLVTLVDDLSFVLRKGETLAIAGESGSGKSLTSLAIMGLLPPPAVRVTAGTIQFEEQVLTRLSEQKMRHFRGNRIAMIFQEPMTALNPVMRIGAQLVEAIRAHESMSQAQADQRALDALRAVRLTEPERRLTQFPHELSGGMRQRVVIAMAIALKPDVLIADEPTTALDVTVQRDVLDLLQDLSRDLGTALILITHDMGVVAEMADHVLVMQKGKAIEMAPVRQLFAAPAQEYTRALLDAVPRMGDGKNAKDTVENPLISVRDLKVSYDIKGGFWGRVSHRVHAVAGVSFEIFPGETFAIVGESGCGKSTIARALTGLVPHRGEVLFDGKILGDTAQARRDRTRDLQMVFQDPMAALNGRMTVGALVREPLDIHQIGTVQSRQERTVALFEKVDLPADAINRYPHEFSGGQRQRICIARALSLAPKLIIADESVSALDVSVQAKVLGLLEDLKRDMAISYLFISHDMAVVENVADRVAVMHLGQIVEMGTGAQIFGDPRHPYTRRLIEAVPQPDPTRERNAHLAHADDPPSPVLPIGQNPSNVDLEDVGDGHLVGRH